MEREKLRSSSNLDQDEEIKETESSLPTITPITKVTVDDLEKAEQKYNVTMDKLLSALRELREQRDKKNELDIQIAEDACAVTHKELKIAHANLVHIREQIGRSVYGDGVSVAGWLATLFGYVVFWGSPPSMVQLGDNITVHLEKSSPSSSSSSPSIGSSLKNSSNSTDKIKKYRARRVDNESNNTNIRHRGKHIDNEGNNTNMKD